MIRVLIAAWLCLVGAAAYAIAGVVRALLAMGRST